MERLEERTLLTPVVVDHTGTGSGLTNPLCVAISMASSRTGGVDEVHFNLSPDDPGFNPTTGVWTFTPADCLLPITNSVTIDGTTQPGYSVGHPVIEIQGEAGFSGLHFLAGGNTVKGLIINNWGGSGIILNGTGKTSFTLCIEGTQICGDNEIGAAPGSPKGGSVIEGNFIGTDATGKLAESNGRGILVVHSPNNTIGGRTEAARNIISGNRKAGIELSMAATLVDGESTTGNHVEGNYIGTDVTGLKEIRNGAGVVLAAPNVAFLRQGNDNPDGYASGNFIGGPDPSARNIIAGNAEAGVYIFRGRDNKVQGNYIGVGADGVTPIPNGVDETHPDQFGQDGVFIEDASSNLVGGVEDNAGNLISANIGSGVRILAAQRRASSNGVQGNLIGTDKNGEFRPGLANVQNGVEIRNDSSGLSVIIADTQIGGVDADDGAADGIVKARNIISGNLGSGVLIAGHDVVNTSIRGNYIGTNKAGDRAVANFRSGILITSLPDQSAGPGNTTIGGLAAGARNVISGNIGNGIYILGAANNQVADNYIGLGANGTTPVRNGRDGVRIEDASDNLIGGIEDSLGHVVYRANVISGNRIGVLIVASSQTEEGIVIPLANQIAKGNRIQANLIGTDASGTKAPEGLSNENGVVLANTVNDPSVLVSDNVVGGTDTADGATDGIVEARNIISGNLLAGITLANSGVNDNRIQGNFIGTDISGSKPLGNLHGILVSIGVLTLGQSTLSNGNDSQGPKGNLIGSAAEGDAGGNVISANRLGGIRIANFASLNRVVANFIGTDRTGLITDPDGIPDTGDELGNHDVGVGIVKASLNTIGGADDWNANVIGGNFQSGVLIAGNAADNKVQNNLIGVGTAGDKIVKLPNRNGVLMISTVVPEIGSPSRNLIGGTQVVEGHEVSLGNIISANRENGVEIGSHAGGNDVVSNFIGTDRTTTAHLGNGINGVAIIDSSFNIIIGNFVEDNGGPDVENNAGILIKGVTSTDNILAGNFIGIGANDVPIGNRGDANGVLIDNAQRNVIGRNVISGNRGAGVRIEGNNARFNELQGNFIGTTANGNDTRPNTTGVSIEAAALNVIGKLGESGRNIISGNKTNVSFFHAGAGNVVQNNYIGLTATGTAALISSETGLATSEDGVSIFESPGTTIGGDQDGTGNVISGNKGNGIIVSGALSVGTQIKGNYIGTDKSAANSVKNGFGVVISATDSGAATQTIVTRNVIAGNLKAGIRITLGGNNSKIAGNYIGTNADGSATIPNGGSGVEITEGASSNIIGGNKSDSRNIISANKQFGIQIDDDAHNNFVWSNFIGTKSDGSFDKDLGNRLGGISISDAHENFIGDAAETAGLPPGNTILGNLGPGVLIAGSDAHENVVQGNAIARNGSDGVRIEQGAHDNFIGGETNKGANSIHDNDKAGVSVQAGISNTIVRNRIFANVGLGIDLAPEGVTENDVTAKDQDSGPNNLQNFPVLSFATTKGSQRMVGALGSARRTSYTFQFFANAECDPGIVNAFHFGEAERFLFETTLKSNASGVVIFDLPLPEGERAGTFLTATATDPEGNTSEFSNCVEILTDTDGDGISDARENAGPNGGDANLDGIPDSQQLQIATFLNAFDSGYVTLVGPVGTFFRNVTSLPNPSPDDAPAGVQFDQGFFDFEIRPVAIGAQVTVEMILQGRAPHNYYRYGPTPDNPSPHWYNWLFDGQTGAEIHGNRITLHFVDGGRGDDDLVANGIIEDAGAPAFPDPFTVITTADSGDGSLRQVILNANANPGLDKISFDILDVGPLSIQPLSALPTITDPVVIDGSTQPAFAGTPIVELDGSLAGTGVNGLTLAVAGGPSFDEDGNIELSIIRGLVINRFSASGIRTELGGQNTIEGNFIGTDLTGTSSLGNGSFGVEIDDSSDNSIGGTTPDAGNVISGNAAGGIFIHGAGALGTVLMRNTIGTQADGTSQLGNGGPGVLLDGGARVSLIGLGSPAAGNTIAFNAGAGVEIRNASATAVRANSIFSNGGLGIDLGGDGVTPNDDGDSDAGSNNLQNFPVLTRVARHGDRTFINGTLRSTPNSTFTVEFYASTAADPSGFGEGQTFLGSTSVSTDSTGQGAIAVNFEHPVAAGSFVIATATDRNRNTSEFSELPSEIEVPAPPPFVFTVDTIDDVDDGLDCTHTSLREAILAANAHAGPDIIQFNIAGENRTISPTSPLPEITDPVTIDGTTQPGYAGLPLIELEGSQAGDANGLRITGGGSVVRGLVINQFHFDTFSLNPTGGGGIVLAGAGGNRIEGNFLGTDVTGTSALPNDTGDVRVDNSTDNLIGGTTPAARNIINAVSFGFRFALGGSNNRVQGNYIGTDLTGSALLLGSPIRGISSMRGSILIQGSGNVVGGTEPGAGNVIANGVFISLGRDNVVQGNLIGTDATGTRSLAGIESITALGFVIRGSVELQGGSPATTVVNNLIGGTTPAARNIIANTVRISGFSHGNLVQGNYIGTDITGTVDLPGVPISPFGTDAGVEIAGSNNTIGGTTPGAGNLISGNVPTGVFLDRFAAFNVLQGNRIGTDVTGTKALGNVSGILSIGHDNTIGGSIPGAGNLISGNLGDGVRLVGFGRNVVKGNFIGTDVTGTMPLGNATLSDTAGVLVRENNDVIGGPEPGAGNVISGNLGNGITSAGSGTVIQGNFIGTDVTGTARLGNSGFGVGGGSVVAGNVISANGRGGVAGAVTVQGNKIGTDVTGTHDLGNFGDGVSIANSSFVTGNNSIGGTDPAAGNVIAFNSGRGVIARFGTGNAIRHNAIFANGELGIVSGINGVMSSYAEQRGADLSSSVPVLISAIFDGQETILEVTLTGTPFTRYALDVFANDAFDPSGFGEGQTFLESFTLRTGATGQAQVRLPLEEAVPVGRWITATATDPAGNTSQFSRAIPVLAAADPNTLQFTAPAYLVTENGGEAVVVVTRTGSVTGTVTVDFTTSDGSATAGSDYAVTSGTLTFDDGETSKTITIPISDDAIIEGDETFQIRLSNPIGLSVGSLSDAIVTIADNDVHGQLDFAVSALSISEGLQLKLQVKRTGGNLGRVSVDYRVTGGTATPCAFGSLDISCNNANFDYPYFFGTLTFEDGQTTAEIAVSAFDDQSPDGGLFEGPETVEVSLGNPTGGAVLGPVTRAVLTILDDEDLHGAFAVSGVIVNESAGSATITVHRAGNRSEIASVDVAIRDVTATAGSDYTVTFTSGTLTFFPRIDLPVNDVPADSVKTISIPILNDALVEGQETFEVFLTGPTGGAILSPGADRDVVIIKDDDSPGSFDIHASTVHENADSIVMSVDRRDGAKGVARVNFATSDGTARAGSDYTATSGTLTFNNGETSKTISVPILRDKVIEGDETFLVTLSDPTGGATLGSDNTAVVTIFEMAGEFEFLASSHTVAEANAGFTVTVTLTRFPESDQLRRVLERPVTVDYMIEDGTAQAGADYSAVAGTLTFGLAETRKTFTIPILNDSLVEGGETILLTLSGATAGVGFGDRATATLTIVNEDFDGPPPNQAQILTPDVATTEENMAVTTNVLTNDPLPHGQALVLSAFDVTSAHGGTVSCTTTGDCTYTPAADFAGTDTFSYTASDVCGGELTTTVSITVNPLNDSPRADHDTAITDEDMTVTKNVLGNDTDADGDTLTVNSFDATSARGGLVTCTSTGDCTYTPAADFNGTDTFSYSASDDHGGMATATVTVTVNPLNDAPRVSPDMATTDEDTTVTKNVLSNDMDADGDILAVISFDATSARGGTVSCTPTGDCTYTPAADFNGTDTFSYTASDGHGGTAAATVTITVNPVNDAPQFEPGPNVSSGSDGLQVVENWASATVSGPDNETGQSLHFVLTTDRPDLFAELPSVQPDGSLRYTPQVGTSGVATLTVQLVDDAGIDRGGSDRTTPRTFTIAIAATTGTNETACSPLFSTAMPRTAAGGDVRVRVSRGALLIRGDSADNAIQLDGLTAGSYEIRGLAGTTINGRSEPFRATAITGLTKIDLAAGSDTLILNAPVTLGQFTILGGPIDTVAVGSRFTSRAANSPNDRDMIVLIDALLARGLTVRTGRDADEVALCDVASDGPVRISTGSDSDIVQLDNLIAQGPLGVTTGRGNDAVMIEQAPDTAGTPSVMQGPVKLRTRRGNDRVLIGSNGSPANGSQFRNRTRIRGGRGHDLIDAALDTTPNSRGNQFPSTTQIHGIETQS